jgi:predicted nucleotidyltransferase
MLSTSPCCCATTAEPATRTGSSGRSSGSSSPRLLGRDAARVAAPATRAKILALLDDTVRLDRLLRDMARALRPAEDPIAEAEVLIAQFKTGLLEA